MDRRSFLSRVVAVATLVHAGKAPSAAVESAEQVQARWRQLVPEGVVLPGPDDKLVRSDRQWREVLQPLQYRVLREEETEPARSSRLNDEKRPGIYVCAGCDLPLFSSKMKFESGTGWPSFFTTIPDAFETKRDFVLFIPRTEYHCARCGGHHGHVFDDGPAPTYERWCNNGIALRFIPADA